MCGIVGYIGKENAKKILINGLKKLEYRGYDSAGVAVISKRKLKLRRCEGKIAKLEKLLCKDDLEGTVGVGHTRWATHGRPSEENAHPHTDCSNKLVVVHNGIIENYLTLKKKLQKEGHRFRSETDTEVLAHLVEKKLKATKKRDLAQAVQAAVKDVRGSFAIAVISADDDGKIIAARQDSPLIIGLGKDEFLVASDIPAVLAHTRKVISLDDGEVAEITRNGVIVSSSTQQKINKKAIEITWDSVMAEKSGFKHFMLKEIYEQPRVIQETFMGRLDPDKGKVHLEESNLSDRKIKRIKKIFFLACGTAYHAGLVGKFLVEEMAGIPCEVDIASEFRYRRKPLLSKEDLVVIVSQSGETADTLAALREAKEIGARTLAVCNVVGSSATREADGVIYTHCGPEIGVASTKAFVAQLVVLYIMAIHFGRIKGRIKAKDASQLMTDLIHIPKSVEKILRKWKKKEGKIPIYEMCIRKYRNKRDFLYIGRNINYPVALEGALKLKEISYIHAEGYPAGEMKHGPIALIDQNMPIVVIATQSAVYDKILSNIEEAKARGGIVIALVSKGDRHVASKADVVFEIPKTSELLYPILNSIVLQLLAYHIANSLGKNIDQPRNLAKSVVVE